MSTEFENEERRDSADHGYSISLQHAASALWGEGFWGREQPMPELQRPKRKSSGR